jgi:hypothetical protein
MTRRRHSMCVHGTLYPIPYTPYPIPYALYPIPYTLGLPILYHTGPQPVSMSMSSPSNGMKAATSVPLTMVVVESGKTTRNNMSRGTVERDPQQGMYHYF